MEQKLSKSLCILIPKASKFVDIIIEWARLTILTNFSQVRFLVQ